jgi:hypothetical protein
MTVYSTQDAERRREFYERVPVESINSARRLQDLTVEMCGHGEAAMDAFEHITRALLNCTPHMSVELLTAKVNGIVAFIYDAGGCGEEEARPYSPSLGAEEPGSPSPGETLYTVGRGDDTMLIAQCTVHCHDAMLIDCTMHSPLKCTVCMPASLTSPSHPFFPLFCCYQVVDTKHTTEEMMPSSMMC